MVPLPHSHALGGARGRGGASAYCEHISFTAAHLYISSPLYRQSQLQQTTILTIFVYLQEKTGPDSFFTMYGHCGILCKSVEPFEQIVNIPLTEGPMWNLVKIGQAVSEKETFKAYTIFYMYIAQMQGRITLKGKLWLQLKGFITLIKHYK